MKLVILDVDGTLTPRRRSSKDTFERILLPGVEAKLAALKQQGVMLALATNQGGADRERSTRLSMGEVLAHLRWLQRTLGIDAFKFATTAKRKKPQPTMLNELMLQFNVKPRDALFVGDDDNDKLAAKAAGIQFVFAHEFFTSYASQSSSQLNPS